MGETVSKIENMPIEGTFVVDYCFNCDGGDQEKNTAREAILLADPDAKIEMIGHDSYPARIRIKNGDTVIWEGPQRNLFQKYPDLREKTIEKIEEKTREFNQHYHEHESHPSEIL